MMRGVEVNVGCPCCGHDLRVTLLPGEAGERDDWEDPKDCECLTYVEGSDLGEAYRLEVLARAQEAARVGAVR